MPIKAVKQKPMANMDFMRTYKNTTTMRVQCKLNIRFSYIIIYVYIISLFAIGEVNVFSFFLP